MDSCIKNYDNCKSLVYLDQPKSCTFYNKKKFKDKNELNNDYDIYTIKNLNDYHSDNDLLSLDSINVQTFKKETDNPISISNIPLYNCAGLYSTNPFCTNELNLDKIDLKDNYINYTDCTNNDDFNKECKKKYGNEYVFDKDIFNLKSVIDCNNGKKRAKCKLDFNDIIENFENKENNYNNIYILIFTLIIIFIILFY